ncbi:hypothetical protein [Streptomyces sp. NPDC055210]
MAQTIPLVHALDDARLSPAAPACAGASAGDGGVRYHHPHYLSAEQIGDRRVRYAFREFTGCESEPATPLELYRDPALTSEQCTRIARQYAAARVLWSQRRLRLRAAPLLATARLRWTSWQLAHEHMQSLFTAFTTLEDNRWRSHLMRLLDAHRVARQMAADWDDIAEQLAAAVADQHAVVDDWSDEVDLTVVAAEQGIDTMGWLIEPAGLYAGTPYYRTDTPLVARLVREIDEQRARLVDIAHLAADHDSGRRLAADPH